MFGDDIALSEGFIPFKFSIGRVTDPAELIPHLFEQTDASFASRVKPGDIVFGGREFACGKPHIQGFIAMSGLGLGVLCTSMPYMSLRSAVARGVPVLSGCGEPANFASTGDEIVIDFVTGKAKNLSRQTDFQFPPMPSALSSIVADGGAAGNLDRWLVDHPRQAKTQGSFALQNMSEQGVSVKFMKKVR